MLSRVNSHSRDSAIEFYDELNEREHVYVIQGASEHPKSVTTLIHDYFPHFDSDKVIGKWYNRWQKNPNHKYYGMSREEIKKMWDESGKKASELGTAMHN